MDKISTNKSHMIETPKKASSSFLETLSFKSTNTNQLHSPTSRPLCIIRYQQLSPVYNILIIYKLARKICYYCCGKFKCILPSDVQGVGGIGRYPILPLSLSFFLSFFFLEGKTSAPDVFSTCSFILRAHI